MRILLTIAGLSPDSGGPSRSVPALAKALAEAGADIRLLSLDYGPAHGIPLLPDPTRIRTELVRCRLSRRIPTVWAWHFRRVLRRAVATGVDVIHDQGVWLPTNELAGRVARQTGVPLVVSPRGMLSAWSLQFRGIRKRLAWGLYQRRVLESARVLHATAAAEAGEFRALGLTPPISVIPNGIDLPAPRSRPVSPASGRTALFLSRIHPKKGLLYLVDAWAALRPPGWNMLIVGPDEAGHQGEVEARIHQAGLSGVCQIAAPVHSDAKWELYRQADLFVLPSHSENFGIVVAEALACGVPVITTRGTPWSELVSHRCGWWIEIGVEPLRQALADAISLTDDERHAMGLRGRKLVEERYSWPSAAEQMMELYRWVLNGNPPLSSLYAG